ncbi:MAG: hypothetical protein R3C68_08990 [Myxococcota bacterium]
MKNGEEQKEQRQHVSDEIAHRLLSDHQGMSPVQRDNIRSHVLKRRARWSITWPIWVLPLATASLVALVLGVNPSEPTLPEFYARGTGDRVAALSIVCTADPQSCRLGDTLLFEIDFPETKPYFAAFSRAADGLIVWYIPDGESGSSIDLRQQSKQGLLRSGVFLGPPHKAGAYQLYGLFSSAPLDRHQIRNAVEGETTVAERTIRVVPFTIKGQNL